MIKAKSKSLGNKQKILTKHNKRRFKIFVEIFLHALLIFVLFAAHMCYKKQVFHNEEFRKTLDLLQSQNFQLNFPSRQVRPYDQYLLTWWTDRSPLSQNRIINLPSMINSQLRLIYINLDNLHELILKDHPLHSAFQYLSGIQKGDYLKAYFMNLYGGGYSDLKRIEQSYVPGRDKLRENTSLFGVGYYQISIGDIAINPNDTQFYNYLSENNRGLHYVGNGNYIFRPITQFTLDWYNKMMDLMEEKKDMLKKYPAKHGRQQPQLNYPYPIRWGQLNGWIFSKVQYKYGLDAVSDGIPYVIMKDHI